jgi:hypothetical protein
MAVLTFNEDGEFLRKVFMKIEKGVKSVLNFYFLVLYGMLWELRRQVMVVDGLHTGAIIAEIDDLEEEVSFWCF